jgi:hypothetical protein
VLCFYIALLKERLPSHHKSYKHLAPTEPLFTISIRSCGALQFTISIGSNGALQFTISIGSCGAFNSNFNRSFVPERHQRIDFRRAARGDEARDESHR